jgi:hypothetical protein
MTAVDNNTRKDTEMRPRARAKEPNELLAKRPPLSNGYETTRNNFGDFRKVLSSLEMLKQAKI